MRSRPFRVSDSPPGPWLVSGESDTRGPRQPPESSVDDKGERGERGERGELEAGTRRNRDTSIKDSGLGNRSIPYTED
jgi:hypothetical protein